MKNITSIMKPALYGAACLSLGLQAQAQNPIEFTTDFATSEKLRATHRTVPLFADFNNNGHMDVYYSGTSWKHGWTSGGFLVKNQGNLEFEMDTETITETYEEVLKDQYDQDSVVVRTRTLGMKSGLPYSAYGAGSLAIDYNQDGLTDFLFLNRGGNDTGTKKAVLLVKNLGNYQFEVVNDTTLVNLSLPDNNDCFNDENDFGCMAVGDYDKDGYPDVLIECSTTNGRAVKLLHNEGGTGFKFAKVFNPQPFEVETNKTGVYVKSEPTLDADGIEVPGHFTNEPTMEAKPMTHGQVAFGDFDGDGWLDIVASGYTDGQDGDEPQVGGDQIRFYKNLQNGEFQDVTTDLLDETLLTPEDVYGKWGNEDAALTVLDYNGDGKVDLLFIGSMRNRSTKQAVLLLNISDGSKFAFTEEATILPPISGAAARLATCADLNGDGYPDFLYRGWTDYDGINDWRYAVSSSEGSTSSYHIDLFNENVHNNGYYCEQMTYGDFDGDYKLDAFATNWVDGGDTVYFIKNTTDCVIEAPEVPTGLVATAGDGKITLTWDRTDLQSGNEALYNVYVKNNATNQIYMRVPANEETGYQKAYLPFGAYLLGGEEATYTFEHLPVGDYTVGVQAVSYSYAASTFATATASVITGIDHVGQTNDAVRVAVGDNAITVRAAQGTVAIYDATGACVAMGATNEALPVASKGVFMVRVNNRVLKVVK